MSRFSLRAQVFLLTAAFMAALAAVSGLALLNQRDLSHAINNSNIVFEEAVAVSGLMEHLDHSVSDLLLFAVDPENEWSEFTDGVAETRALIVSATAKFEQDTRSNAAIRADLAEVDALLAQLPAYFEDAESEALFGQLDTLRDELLPRLTEAEGVLETLLQTVEADSALVRSEAEQIASMAQTRLILMSSAVILSALLVAFFFGQALSRPVMRAQARIAKMVQNDYLSAIEDQARGDEVGGIARGLEELRGKLLEAERSEERTKEENGRRVDLFQTLGVAMSQLRGGQLNARIEADEWHDLGDSYVKLCRDFNELASALDGLVKSLRSSSETVQGNARELSDMSDEMERRAELQAATLKQSAAALESLSVGVNTAADKAQEADEKVVEGRQRAEQGGEVMGRALDAMSSIAKSSEQISEIIGVIDDIAFQTNLLALNAGVEAARAGESGKGFSVVASEVRGLAQRASASANEIKELVLNSVDQVEDGERLVQETSETLTHIVASVTEVSEMVSAIAALSREQAGGVEEINIGIGELDKVTRDTSGMVSETSSASQQLTVEATRLSDLLTRFTGGGVGATMPENSPSGVPELFGDGGNTNAGDGGEGNEIALFEDLPAGSASPEAKTSAEQSDTKTEAAPKLVKPAPPKPTLVAETQPQTPSKKAKPEKQLVKGDWADESKNPKLTPAEDKDKIAVNAPPTQSSSTLAPPADDDLWKDF